MANTDKLADLKRLLTSIDRDLDSQLETYKNDCMNLEDALKVSRPSPDYPYRVRNQDKVYCFRTLQDLMSRVVVPEEVEGGIPQGDTGASSRPSSSSTDRSSDETPLATACRTGRLPQELKRFNDLMERYLHLRTTMKPSLQQKNCIDKLNKLIKHDNEVFKLFYGDLADMMESFFDRKKPTEKDQVDHLKILQENCDGDDKTAADARIKKELNEYFDEIQLSVTRELVKCLKSIDSQDNVPKEELFKVFTALRDLRTLKMPVLIKSD